MRKRLTSLVLVMMLSGSAFAGVPWQSGEHSCGMDHSMDGMDCCKAALMDGKAQASIAKLCCALNCSKEGTTPNAVPFARDLQLSVSTYPSILQSISSSRLLSRRFDQSHGPPLNSHPAYIRNSALLI